jgi:glutamine amidotransferase
VVNALDLLGYEFKVSKDKEDIVQADVLILPGVGAFGEAMKNIEKFHLREVLRDAVLIQRKPILGICLGMQLLAESSEENGNHEGLGILKGRVIKLSPSLGYRIPHVGWDDLVIKKLNPIFSRVDENTHFYFDHSYHFVAEQEDIAATYKRGHEIVAAVQKDNIVGVQFHPEKSQTSGLKLFRSFFNSIRLETHA